MEKFSFGKADDLQSAASLKIETLHRFRPGMPSKVAEQLY